MSEIQKLTRNSDLHSVITTINALIDSQGQRDEILDTLVDSSIGEKVVYTASPDVFVSGEVYIVKTSGLYQVKAVGEGKSHFLIDQKRTGKIIEHQEVEGSYTSPEFMLSEGDKVIFWAVSTPEGQLSISLTMNGNFFTILQQILETYTEMNEKVTKLLDDYTGVKPQVDELMRKADTILNNHTNQVAQLQRDITKISERISSLP